MKLSFSTLGCPNWTLTQIAENAAAYGFDGVELRIDGNKHVDPSFDSEQRADIRRMFAERHIAIASLAGYTRFCGDDREKLAQSAEALLRNIDLAADLGAPYVRSFMGDGAFLDMGADVLRDCCSRAKERGVVVLVETHDSYQTGEKIAEVLAKVGSDALAALWDIQHSVLRGEEPADTWRALEGRILHVHMKDVDANRQICHIGDGILPIGTILRLFEQNAYDGFLSFEWEKMWHPNLDEPEVAFRRYMAYMRP